MSELDADLYGDLYGNDEAEFASAVESHELKPEAFKTEAPSETPVPPAAKAPEVRQELKTAASAPQPIKSEYSEPHDDYIASSPQLGLSAQNTPQQIPTYQQPSDYSVDVSLSGVHANMPERSIRPSEMKDEG
ncbi:hypothetical protein L210DRAFT_3767858 [Boletus edulis BED1]|uniref:Uncharacterized protein n=1 Tax=Boletus edulis BED1 TaxID=1328754 RepID=A0AAD4BBK8_BOLED|nr:hypothetical protein L210DRAFT_3767858 [Boletus edulis BED1]